MDFAITVKAVIIKDGRFLLLRRSKREMEKSFLNRYEPWDLPGGGVRFFETSQRALFREIREETQLDVRLIGILNAYDAIKSRLHMLILTYMCEYIGGEVILSCEHDSYYWLTVEEMESLDVPKWMIRIFKSAVEYKY